MNNPQVAELIGLSPSSVSRLRAGVRQPTLETMRRCEDVFDWPIDYQDRAARDHAWAQGFENRLTEYEEAHAAAEAVSAEGD